MRRKYVCGVNAAVAELFADFQSILDEVHMKLRRDTSERMGSFGFSFQNAWGASVLLLPVCMGFGCAEAQLLAAF